jgi:hypothetical protein
MEYVEGMEGKFSGLFVEKAKPETLVESGKKGVTNAQMIPAIKKYIDLGDSGKLLSLKQYYPQIYISSLKYLSKPYQQKLDTLIK